MKCPIVLRNHETNKEKIIQKKINKNRSPENFLQKWILKKKNTRFFRNFCYTGAIYV